MRSEDKVPNSRVTEREGERRIFHGEEVTPESELTPEWKPFHPSNRGASSSQNLPGTGSPDIVARPKGEETALDASGKGYQVCRIRIPLPDGHSCLQRVSLRYPRCTISILGEMICQKTLVRNLSVEGPSSLEEMAAALESSPDTRKVERYIAPDGQGFLRLSQEIPSPCLPVLLCQWETPPHLPYHIQAGVISLLLATDPPRFHQFFNELKNLFPQAGLVSIKHNQLPTPHMVLTPRQKEIFHTALRSGLWDAPRRITMVELAMVLNISKSTLSETISQIESKLLHEIAGDQFSSRARVIPRSPGQRESDNSAFTDQ